MNQVRPGAYIGFESISSSLSTISSRGITVLPLELNILEPHTLYKVSVYTDFDTELGVSLTDPEVLCIKEALKNAETVIIYRLNEEDEAEASYEDYVTFFNSIKTEEFNTVAITSEDNDVKLLAMTFAETMRDTEQKKIQCVVSNMDSANYEGIVNVTNGVVLSDDTEIPANLVTCYVAGALAGAEMYESLTHSTYTDAVSVSPKYTNEEIATRLSNGEFLFSTKRSKVVVEQDINSFTDYSPTKDKSFSKNRVIRILDNIATDIKTIFEDYYLGKVSNNATGRSLFASECITYLRKLEQLSCIENFSAMDDIKVLDTDDSDTIYISLNVKPIDSVEKLFMTVYLN